MHKLSFYKKPYGVGRVRSSAYFGFFLNSSNTHNAESETFIFDCLLGFFRTVFIKNGSSHFRSILGDFVRNLKFTDRNALSRYYVTRSKLFQTIRVYFPARQKTCAVNRHLLIGRINPRLDGETESSCSTTCARTSKSKREGHKSRKILTVLSRLEFFNVTSSTIGLIGIQK